MGAGQTIRIKFLDNKPEAQDIVKDCATEWMIYANIKFIFVQSNEDAEVRISFDSRGGYWSAIGTDCLKTDKNAATMNFGIGMFYSYDNFRTSILHEFGHMLGLQHEHQNPNGGPAFNIPLVYAYYLREFGWTKKMVDEQIFAHYSTTQTNSSSYDKASIMHYDFPASLIINGISYERNHDLSATDKRIINQIYPFPTFSLSTWATRQGLFTGSQPHVTWRF